MPNDTTAGQAARLLSQIRPSSAVAEARCELATELLADIRHLDTQRREAWKKLAAAAGSSGSSITEVFGAGPVIAAAVIGDVVTLHQLRHSRLTHLGDQNVSAPLLMALSGHKRLATLQRYVRPSPRPPWRRCWPPATRTAVAADRDRGMSPKDAEHWRAARTLAGLGELTARWLEGKIASIPTVWPGCGPDEQTTDLIPVLAACNRAGYGTTVSQPGEEPAPGYDGRLGTQRAAVQGFASADAAAAHRACTAATPLIVLVTGPAHDMERRQEIRIPVTLAGDQETRGSAAISTAVTSKTIRPDTASAAPTPSTRWVLPGRSPSSTRSGAATTCSGRPWSRSRGGHQVLPGLVPATAAADRGLCRRARHQLIAVRPLGVAGEPSVRRLVMSSRTSP